MTESNKTSEKEITLGEFFERYKVCIPILQRDYAQGRAGKEYIRESILEEIKSAVCKNNKITLDFVYGYEEKGVFYLLDGQQRLTTLWLIYWYLSVRAGKLNAEGEHLKKFTYKTRRTSREFCHALCEGMLSFDAPSGIVDYIKEQKWFVSSWQKDPTINGMLRMLGGTNNKDGVEPVYNELFKKRTHDSTKEWYLTNLKNNINFCVKIIGSEEMPKEAADQLYVKMNARGKALTDFENFKADLVKTIHDLSKNPNYDLIKDVPKKLDNSWNDMFWKSSKAWESDGKTDEVFFAFINRFCFNQLCIQKDENGVELLRSDLAKKINKAVDDNSNLEVLMDDLPQEQKNSLFEYKYFSQNSNIRYTDYSFYKRILNPDGLITLNNILDHISENTVNEKIQERLNKINTIVSRRKDTNYHFLPVYKNDKNGKKELFKDDNGNDVGIVKETTFDERVYFFAICKYFEVNENFDEEKFADWLRFCRNVIENSAVDSVATMISVMRKINNRFVGSLGEKSILDILHLPSSNSYEDTQDDLSEKEDKAKFDTQIQEEIQKANQIKRDQTNTWKEKIHNAEDTLFLCGKISFLFTDENGDEKWNDFDEKLINLKTFFPDNTASIDFVRNYAKSFESFWEVENCLIFHNRGWQQRGDSWLDVLSDEKEHDRVHKALMNESFDKAQDNNGYKSFVESDAFKCAVVKSGVFAGKKNLRITWYSQGYALYKKGAQNDKLCFDIDILSDQDKVCKFLRNKLLKELSNQESFHIADNQIIADGEAYYYGDSIYFSYIGKDYFWSSDDCIYAYDRHRGTKSKSPIIAEASKLDKDFITNKLS